MGIAELAGQVKAERVACRDLLTLKSAYLADHPEINRQRNSKYLMADIRSALAEQQVLIFPEDLDSHEESRTVYLIAGDTVLQQLLVLLKVQPNHAMAGVLASLKFGPPEVTKN